MRFCLNMMICFALLLPFSALIKEADAQYFVPRSNIVRQKQPRAEPEVRKPQTQSRNDRRRNMIKELYGPCTQQDLRDYRKSQALLDDVLDRDISLDEVEEDGEDTIGRMIDIEIRCSDYIKNPKR